jgi:hypothetical protein
MDPEVRKINLSLMNRLIGLMVIRDEQSFANSGDVWREGTERFARLEAPRLDSLLQDALRGTTHLLGHSRELGVTSTDDPDMNSGGVL